MISNKLPESWLTYALGDLVTLNPKLDKSLIADELEVSFVPMPAVEAETGSIDVSDTKSFREVKKGYTPFKEDDVLFAKITPCMENGKMAVAPKLLNDLGFGSTEFHVLRPVSSLLPKFIYFYISSKWFRYEAEHNMTGAVGQRRVPKLFLEQTAFPLPPLNEQKRIVAKIEELFSELDKGIESLQTAREQLKVYRQAALKHAFEGKLTEQWRKDNADKLESPEQLLARIQHERNTRYQQQLEDWKTAVKEWEANGKEGKKPGKPAKPSPINQAIDEDLPELPLGWMWIEYLGLCELIRNGISAKPSGDSGSKIFRISAVRAMKFDLSDIRYLQNEDGQYDDFFLESGDLVFTRYNGTRDFVGVCAEYRGDGSHLYPDKLIRTKLAVSSIAPSFLEKAINCGGSRRYMEKRIRTTAGQSGISGGDVKSMPVPICSALEQKMINSYLEEQLSKIALMENEIEVGLTKAESLRQSILKKAFSGQLVPQDPNDEPASELLARIQAEKAALSAKAKKTPAKRGRQAKEVSE